jgi:hypothetical protein
LDISAKIENLNYRPKLLPDLPGCSIGDFESGKMAGASSFVLNHRGNVFGVSQWVSPKRTRTYPYARVYDTMGSQLRITIIPFVKDEGFDGDRDFIQWDSVSLMSLLNVYVIIGYYKTAARSARYKNKITDQVLDYAYLREQVDKMIDYRSSALHWNLNQLENLPTVAERAARTYEEISRSLGVRMHSSEGMEKRIQSIKDKVVSFKDLSRKMAKEAQHREICTAQPKESTLGKKATITIINYLGGVYHLTVDQTRVISDRAFLMEMKHSKTQYVPHIADIKDGLVKMMLFANLSETRVDSRILPHTAVLGLTSSLFTGYCDSTMSDEEVMTCIRKGTLSETQQKTITEVFAEARENKFLVFLSDSERPDYQERILKDVNV